MKNSTTAALTAAIVLAAGTPAAAAVSASPAAKDGCYVTAKSATVRAKPTTKSPRVGIAYRGQRCRVLEGGTGKWTKVKMRKGAGGWVATRLLHTGVTAMQLD